MSSITGIRILAKEKRILRFKTFLLHQDVQKLPRTHGFGVMILLDNLYGKEACLLVKNIGEVDLNQTLVYGQKYVAKLTLSEFENFPLTPEFLNSGNALIEKEQKFTNEEWLPQAIYEMEVTDEKWLEHITVGQTWETALALDNGADPNQKDNRELTAKAYLLKLNRPNKAAILQIFEERGL